MNSLNQVDWTALGSPDLPRWMRNLMSHDRHLRGTAFHSLMVHLAPRDCADCLVTCTEQDRLEVMKRETAFRLAPFLIDLLRDEQVHDDHKVTVLALMEDLLNWKYTEDCLSETAVIHVFRPYMKRLRDVLSQGIDIYKQLTGSESTFIREEAQVVLEFLET
jgi:hypothetical protein